LKIPAFRRDGYEEVKIMAGGWSRDGAVQDQIDASVEDAIKQARSRLPAGEGLAHCEVCAKPIPEARRKAVPGVRLCVLCQADIDKTQSVFTGYNRRGSKDSQLR
jgi:phage/conjugal plasmid C-4 type zinc finger TraR family protein